MAVSCWLVKSEPSAFPVSKDEFDIVSKSGK